MPQGHARRLTSRTEALIDDINVDVKVALNSLAREGYAKYASDPFFARPGGQTS